MSGEKVEYEYHWGRIIGAIAVLLALVAVVVYALNSASSEMSPVSTPTVITSAETPKQAAQQTIAAEQPATKTPAPKAQVDTAKIAINSQPNEEQRSEPQAANTTIEAQPAQGDEAPAAAVSSAEATLATSPAKTERSITIKQLQINIADSSVKRFVLAQAIKDKEPLNSNPKALQLDQQGVATLYAFSEVLGAKDQHLQYQWFYRGKSLAKVKVGVWSQRWRSFSSKFINPQMLGAWRLELSADNKLIASAEFTTELATN